MNMSTVKTMVRTAGEVLRQNSPHILTALGALGVIGTGVATGKAVWAASELIAENDLVEKKEIVKECWPCFIPPVLIGGASIACIIGADCINTKRQAALYALYSAAVEGAKEYEDKVKEMFGEGKEQKVRDAIAQDKINEHPETAEVEPSCYGSDFVKCYDAFSGRYFYNSMQNIRRVQNDLNEERRLNMFVSANDVFYALQMKPTKYGEEWGWNADTPIKFEFSSCIDEHDIPCLVLDYEIGPRQDYRDLM